MNMRTITAAALGIAAAISLALPTDAAANNISASTKPSCVMLPFSDDTRFKGIDSSAKLSDKVMELMMTSGRFTFKAPNTLDDNLQAQLYNERNQEFINAQNAIKNGDLSAVFEGAGFSSANAITVDTAAVGQKVIPTVTANIGRAHQADYLIQGSVIALGTGIYTNADAEIAATLLSNIGGMAGLGFIPSFSQEEAGIGIVAELRIIRAGTGEVVWLTRKTERASKKRTSIGLIGFGSTKLTPDVHIKAINEVSETLVNALIADMDGGKLRL